MMGAIVSAFRKTAAALVAILLACAPGDIALAQTHKGPALWRVRSGESTVYLFGSIHILPSDFVWITRPIEQAMASAELFVSEVPVGDAAIADERRFLLQNGILPRRQSLRGLLSPSEFDVFASVMRTAGIQPPVFERYRPWLASIVLGLAYLHPDSLAALKGADDELIRFAQEHGRQMVYFETPRQQLELLTAASDSAQLTGLKNLIATLSRSRNLEQALRDSWANGEPERLTAIIDDVFRGRQEAQEFLVGRRNRLWLTTINPLLHRAGTSMITVGAAHIGGKDGLIALICNEGYTVERLIEDGGSTGACAVSDQ